MVNMGIMKDGCCQWKEGCSGRYNTHSYTANYIHTPKLHIPTTSNNFPTPTHLHCKLHSYTKTTHTNYFKLLPYTTNYIHTPYNIHRLYKQLPYAIIHTVNYKLHRFTANYTCFYHTKLYIFPALQTTPIAYNDLPTLHTSSYTNKPIQRTIQASPPQPLTSLKVIIIVLFLHTTMKCTRQLIELFS